MEDVQYKELKDMIHIQYKEMMDAIHGIDKNLAEFKGKSEAEHHAVRASIKELEASLDRTKSSIYDGLEARVKHVEMEQEIYKHWRFRLPKDARAVPKYSEGTDTVLLFPFIGHLWNSPEADERQNLYSLCTAWAWWWARVRGCGAYLNGSGLYGQPIT